ncbi:L-ascorbate metabolism protein UlaG (beta-lactamase superfamily) [Hoyosella altamirensis]|uniref:L-ascorbate metabolism protein UlaG (Beta-lactamase superfamily) n=2 Tax=Hoyosella altamirensis TaxID=616997 RepID=A0A839RU54_9ACTN|nr:L-ascorbate metabolism protein UlaG (beta-lactamase superfamily) [Hoyosella altamirensis]
MLRKMAWAGVGAAVAASVASGVLAAWEAYRAIGAPRSRIRPYVAGSPNFSNGTFRNTDPAVPFSPRQAPDLFFSIVLRGNTGAPARQVPLAVPLAPASAGELAAAWFGHSSVLVEVDGHRVLTDPVWSERVSPSQRLGPRRMHPVPVKISQLPQVDAVVISHDHYDHLDQRTISDLVRLQAAPFVVPLGIGGHLRRWGVPERRIIELDWGEETAVGELTISCAPARHFSGRGISRNVTLWASWVLRGPRRSVFFGGDSGYTDSFADLGNRHGPFDLTLLPIGAYSDQWPDVHMTPEEAVQTHCVLNGTPSAGVMMPIHWGTFNLGFHSWMEPIVRLTRAKEAQGVRTAAPMPGQRIDFLKPLPRNEWWLGLA